MLADHLSQRLGVYLRFNSKQTYVEWVFVDFHSLYNFTLLINGFLEPLKYII